MLYQEERKMATNKELEIERNALLLEMAGKIEVIYNILTSATIAQQGSQEEKSERKTRKKTKKAE